ncbi:MAG: CGNR zinc finger domain-containing protein [Gemmatimonadales bacterium]
MTTAAARKPFEWVGGVPALDFTNTVTWIGDGLINERLATFVDLVEWGREAGFLTARTAEGLDRVGRAQPELAGRTLERAHRLRRVLHDVFVAVASGGEADPAGIERLNRFLENALAHLTLQPDGDRWSWTWRQEVGDLDQVLRPVAWSAAQLLTSPDRALLKHCAGHQCGWVFLDRSRNHARRWCDMKVCGNNEKARRFYRSHRSQVTGRRSQDDVTGGL